MTTKGEVLQILDDCRRQHEAGIYYVRIIAAMRRGDSRRQDLSQDSSTNRHGRHITRHQSGTRAMESPSCTRQTEADGVSGKGARGDSSGAVELQYCTEQIGASIVGGSSVLPTSAVCATRRAQRKAGEHQAVLITSAPGIAKEVFGVTIGATLQESLERGPGRCELGHRHTCGYRPAQGTVLGRSHWGATRLLRGGQHAQIWGSSTSSRRAFITRCR